MSRVTASGASAAQRLALLLLLCAVVAEPVIAADGVVPVAGLAPSQLLPSAELAPSALLPPALLPPGLEARRVLAVDRGLAYLATTQLADGSWPGNGRWVGVTATIAFAFLAHGDLPSGGRYSAQITRAIDWILCQQRGDGVFWCGGDAPIYQHALTTLTLAEAFGEIRRDGLRGKLQRAVDVIQAYQNPRGGWRHEVSRQDGDELPSSVAQLMALRSAHNVGLTVRSEVIDAGTAYVRNCQRRLGAGGDGGFVYSYPSGASNWHRTGAGIVCLAMAGHYRDDGIREGLEYLLRFQPVGGLPVQDPHWQPYGVWFTALAFQQVQRNGAWEREAWRMVYQRHVQQLVDSQRSDGSWPGNWGPYPTATALLVLSLDEAVLPILQM